MAQYIDKTALVAEIWKRRIKHREFGGSPHSEYGHEDDEILGIIDTLEVIDPYKMWVQYASIEAGIKAHAEDYSFNIESSLFQQLTEEQQKLWRKEIEQACISGGYAGVELAKDPRYKENLEVKEVNLEKEYEEFVVDDPIFGNFITNDTMGMKLAKHFFELGISTERRMSMTDKEKIRVEIERLISRRDEKTFLGIEKISALKEVLSFIDSLQEEPKPKFRKGDKVIYLNEEYVVEDITDHYILRSTRERTSVPVVHVGFGNEDYELRLVEEPVSEELEEVCEQLAENARKRKAETSSPFFSQTDYIQGVKDGAKWQKNHLWKPADCDGLPEYDREVIALLDNGKVVFAHRPPEYLDGKDIVTGKVTRNYPKTYDKCGWNIQNIKYWLDVELPKEMGL